MTSLPASSREPATLRHFKIILAIIILALTSADVSGQHYPRVVHPRVIPRAELSRDRRSVPPAQQNDERDLQFVSLSDWILKTEPNRQLRFSHEFQIEWRGPAEILEPLDACESRIGAINGLESESQVLLTVCHGDFFGLVNLQNRTYLLEPMTTETGDHLLYEAEFSRTRRDATASASVVYEASKRFYNLSGDTFDAENYEDSPELLTDKSELGRNNELERPVDFDNVEDADDVGYFFDKTWQREKLPTRKTINKFSPPKYLELAIIADYSVIDFHGSRVQQYILALLNIVSAIYKDPSLDSNMQLIVVRVILYTDKRDGMVQQGNARRSLENVNKWNRKLLANSTRSTRHDVAVWLTRLDIGGPSGYAPVSGACDPARSCALNRDEGLTSAFIIAHEVAHILGLSHDGDKNAGNTCAREAASGSIMAPMVAATFHNFHWSTCSRKEFHRRAKHWSCLLNRPSDDEPPIVRNGFNELFSMDEQCRMEFGEGYTRCRTMEPSDLCSYLWCTKANDSALQACKTKKAPPLEGTTCAENKWCISGVCESIDNRHYEPTPAAVSSLDMNMNNNNNNENTWSSWSSWSECSRSCGMAVQHRTRHCSGGSFGSKCVGEAKEYRICNQAECSDYVDLRARQCSRFFEVSAAAGSRRQHLFDNNGTWLPYEAFDGSTNCQLVCYRAETGEIFHTGLDVEDGTTCSYETNDICLNGSCRSLSCDGKLGTSRPGRDACGQCAGDNSTCESVSSKFQRKLRRETTRLAVIPKLSYNIKIVVTILLLDSIPHEGNVKILIRDGQRRKHEIGADFDADGRAPVTVVDGTAFRIERFEEKYVLWSRGPVMSEVVISLLTAQRVVRTGASISVTTNYVISRSELRTVAGRFTWVVSGSGANGQTAAPCSASCGGGFRRRTLLCRDEITRELVSRRKCLSTAKPPGQPELERCNVHSCESETTYMWLPGMWEKCTLPSANSCRGIQQRRLYCVKSDFGERQVTRENELRVYRNTVPPVRCRDSRQPPIQRECGKVPHCDGHWVYSDWSPCSQSCGRGVQTRRARCVPIPVGKSLDNHQQFLLDSCNSTHIPDEVRACKGVARRSPACSSAGGNRCRKDKAQHCARRDLATQCRNSAFRRRCCLSCRSV